MIRFLQSTISIVLIMTICGFSTEAMCNCSTHTQSAEDRSSVGVMKKDHSCCKKSTSAAGVQFKNAKVDCSCDTTLEKQANNEECLNLQIKQSVFYTQQNFLNYAHLLTELAVYIHFKDPPTAVSLNILYQSFLI